VNVSPAEILNVIPPEATPFSLIAFIAEVKVV
jgi:hypothetical protein